MITLYAVGNDGHLFQFSEATDLRHAMDIIRKECIPVYLVQKYAGSWIAEYYVGHNWRWGKNFSSHEAAHAFIEGYLFRAHEE